MTEDNSAGRSAGRLGPVVGLRSAGRVVTREELVEQGVPPRAAESQVVQQNIDQAFMMQFSVTIVVFGLVCLMLFLLQLGLFIWLAVRFLQEGQQCDGPLKLWARVAFFIILFNLTLNRKTARGSLVQRLVCCFTQDPAEPRPVPMRIWVYDILVRCVLPWVWNCLGIHWVLADVAVESPCKASAPGFFAAARVYTIFVVAFSLVAFLGMLGITTVLRYAMRRGLLKTKKGADPQVIESCKVVPLSEMDLQEHPSCSICLEDYCEAEPIVSLGCEHCFHKQCLKNWLQMDRTCPLCRSDVEAPAA